MKELFIEQERWDEGHLKQVLAISPRGDPIRAWIEKTFKAGKGSCLEMGCFPGRYLALFGELGYEVHGIDLTPRVETDLKPWLASRGVKTGDFVRADVFTHDFKRQFDVVCSFGLIEHFGSWAKLLARHAELVLDGGYLVVSTPNFRGWIQRALHLAIDSENYAEHNIDAMVPSAWADVVRPLGFRVIECGWIGPFDFWVGASLKMNWRAKIVYKLLRKSIPLWRVLPDNCGPYAPYCGLIAQKTGTAQTFT
jgi:SAM-dependent methyltransferase